MKSHIDEICKVTCTHNDKTVDAEVMQYKEKDMLIVAMATNKIHMKWTGKVFVGNAFGMEFTSPGPKEHTVKEGRGL